MDRYVDKLTDRQLEIEENVDENKAEIQRVSLELLNNVEKRSDFIFDSMVKSYVNKMAEDVSPEASLEVGRTIAMYMDMTFDELNTVPLLDRSEAWKVASSAIVTGASEQAKIMSGMTQQAMIDGIDNADDVIKEIENMSVEEIQQIQVDIKGVLKQKKEAKKNAKS